MSSSVGASRRANDYQRLRELELSNPESIKIVRVDGNPPQTYHLQFTCRSPEGVSGNRVRFRTVHDVEIRLPAAYPIQRPDAYIRSAIWNPHVFSSGLVCLGSHAWNPGESLDVFVRRLRSILIWDPVVINERSPANREAMDWYRAHRREAPYDAASMRTEVATPARKVAWKER